MKRLIASTLLATAAQAVWYDYDYITDTSIGTVGLALGNLAWVNYGYEI
jgi:hypothetical protein